MDKFWDEYYQKPLNEIPWQNTQADWFKELIDDGYLSGSSALDLGCGTGIKSIYLAEHGGFKKVIGVDISKRAIKYAKTNANNSTVGDICTFITHDLNNWSFLQDNTTFDLILDWAAIHCIPSNKLKKYTNNITKHCKSNGKFLVRSFSSSNPKEKFFTEEINGIKYKVSLFTETDLNKLFPEFQIISKNISHPSKSKSELGYFFTELLMQKN